MRAVRDGHEIAGVECKRATDKALLCVIDGKDEWVPKSQISDDSEVYEAGHYGSLVVTEWLAEQKGWT
jgi:hypothetical protein